MSNVSCKHGKGVETMNDFLRPRYESDSDYTTNAPSYYDDLARKNELLKILANRIWEYDKELAKRFAEWDKNLEDLPEDVKNLLIQWMTDGTLELLINENILNGKADISEIERIEELLKYKTSIGEITLDDVDKSNFQLDGTWFSEEFITELQDGVINVGIELASGQVKSEHIANNAVEIKHLSDVVKSNNLHNVRTDLKNKDLDPETWLLRDSTTNNISQEIKLDKTQSDISFIGYSFITFFDDEGNFVENFYYDTTKRLEATTLTPLPNSTIMRLVYNKQNTKMHINYGSTLLPYDKFGFTFPDLVDFNQNLLSINDIKTSNNLFNPFNITEYANVNLEGEGNIIPHDTNSIYKLDVEPGATYSVKGFINIVEYDVNGVYNGRYAFYDKTKRETLSELTVLDKTSKIIGIFNPTTTALSNIQINKGTTNTGYQPFRIESVNNIAFDNNHKLWGKKVLNFGDSLASADGLKGYHGILAAKYKFTMQSYARGGATIRKITNQAENHTVENQVNQAIADGVKADIILFNGNTNDWGEIGSYSKYAFTSNPDIETYAGAFESVVSKMKHQWPNALIVYVSAHKMGSRGVAEKAELTDIAYDICRLYSIPYADVFNAGTVNTNLSWYVGKYTNGTDVTHVNDLGYEKGYVPLIDDVLNKSLF